MKVMVFHNEEEMGTWFRNNPHIEVAAISQSQEYGGFDEAAGDWATKITFTIVYRDEQNEFVIEATNLLRVISYEASLSKNAWATFQGTVSRELEALLSRFNIT